MHFVVKLHTYTKSFAQNFIMLLVATKVAFKLYLFHDHLDGEAVHTIFYERDNIVAHPFQTLKTQRNTNDLYYSTQIVKCIMQNMFDEVI